jgi:hypothetical protein
MKKTMFVVTIFFVFAFALSLYADTITVLVSGGIRSRGYYVANLTDLNENGGGLVATTAEDGTVTTTYVQDDDQNWIESLVDLYVDAELTDSVFVRINVQAFGTFGNNDWDAYLWEQWVKLANIGGSSWSALVGSTYFNLGNGFLFSDNDAYYLFDTMCLTGDYMPMMVKAAMLRLADEGKDDRDAYLVDVDWAGDDLTLGGTVATIMDGPTDYQPLVVNARATYNANDSVRVFGDAAYELGDASGGLDKNAWAAEVGGSYTMDVQWSPTIRAMYTYASGDDNAADDEDQDYDPWYNYTFYGYAYAPQLTNIQIINVGLDLQPSDFTKLSADFYYYTQAEQMAMVMGRTDMDNPGVTAMTNGTDDQLGSEVDVGLEHTYTDSVTTSLILSYFMPGDAYCEDADDALEIRGEILVSF